MNEPKKKKRFYLVLAFWDECNLGRELFGQDIGKVDTVKLAWLDGQVAACPVFNDREKAKKAANGARVLACELDEFDGPT